MWHRITLPGALRELREVGFASVEVVTPAGVLDETAAAGLDTRDWASLYLVARKA
jgi:hypothetical protein